MTATWTVKIEVLDPAAKTANVTAIRHGEDVRTYTLPAAIVTTKAALATALYALFTADEAKRQSIATLVAGWESDVTTALNAKEN